MAVTRGDSVGFGALPAVGTVTAAGSGGGSVATAPVPCGTAPSAGF